MDNAISSTLMFTAEETPTTRRWLQQHCTQGVKSVSFMTRGYSKHAQVPYQAPNAEEFAAPAPSTAPVQHLRGVAKGCATECPELACVFELVGLSQV